MPKYRTATATLERSQSPTGAGLNKRFEALTESDFYAVATGRTAAWIHGFDVLPPGADEREWPLEYARELPREESTVIDGLPVTNRARTLIDCAADLPRLEAVAAADQFLRAGIDSRSLSAALDPLRGDRLRRANATLLAADPRAESPMESWTRCLLGDAGFPAPVPQLRVRAPGGRTSFLDLGWEAWKVGVEYDGMATHVGLEAETSDHRRHQALRGSGWRVVVVTASEVMEHPRPWMIALRDTLLARGWNPDLSELHDLNARIEAVTVAMHAN